MTGVSVLVVVLLLAVGVILWALWEDGIFWE